MRIGLKNRPYCGSADVHRSALPLLVEFARCRDCMHRDYRLLLFIHAILLSVVLTGAALVITPRKVPTPDTLNYVHMAEGRLDLAITPYRYRIVVPFLASTLSLDPLDALRTITLASLFAVYVLGLAECALLDLPFGAALIAVLTLFCSRPNLSNYYNPFLTDATGLLFIFMLSICFLAGWLLLFTILIAVGVFVRESALFVMPAWLLTDKWKKATLMIGVASLLFAAPRFLLTQSGGYMTYLVGGIGIKLLSISWVFSFIKELFLSWHGVWVLVLFGLWQLPMRVKILGAALAVGALVSCVATRANDYERMLGVLAPIVVPSVAITIERAAHVSRKVVGIFVSTLPIQFLFSNPYVLQSLPLRIYHVVLPLAVVGTSGAAAWVVAKAVQWRPDVESTRG